MSRSANILRNVFTVSGFTALSRVLGLVREMFQSRFIGAGVEQSAFAIAFSIPNMARKLFGEGALTAAFVPIFRDEVEREGLAKAAKLARAVLTTAFAMLAALVALCFAGRAVWAHLAAPLTPRESLTGGLVGILLPYMIFICGAAFGMGVLNALGRFKASSLMPCILNVFWIGGLGITACFPGWSAVTRVRFVAWAILLAGFAQMAFMLWRMAAAGVRPRLTLSGWRSPKMRLVWRNTAIGAFGAGAVQINYMLDQVLAQVAAPWAAGVISYADRLMDLPLGVVAVAFGTVLLPTFAAFFARDDFAGARAAFASSSANMLFLMIPAAVGLGVLAHEVTDVVYAGGAFGAEATVRVARAVRVYAFGLAFFGFHKTLVPWFMAQKDMRTPFRVTLWTTGTNAVLNILAVVLLPVEWRHVGLAASTVLCSALGCLLLILRAHGQLGLAALVAPLVKIGSASAAMAAVLIVLRPLVAPLGAVPGLALLIAGGGLAYLALSAVFMRNALRRLLSRRRRK